MALQVWLPLNGNLNNQGLSNVTVTNNGAIIDDNGKIGKCYKFNPDNSSSGQKYLMLNKNLSDILPINGKSFSFACWIKITGNLYSNGCGLISANQYNATGVGLYINNSTKKIHIHMCYNGTEQEWTATKMAPIQNNVWYHVTYTYNEIGRQMTIYINGVNVDYTTANNVWVTRNEKISIGRGSQGGWGYTLPGFMNDVRIYDHCLSPKEVKELSRGLVLHYKLDNLLNNKIYDCSGYLNNGTITGNLQINNDSPRYNYSTLFNTAKIFTNKDIFFDVNNKISISLWIYPISNNISILGSTQWQFQLRLNTNNKLYFNQWNSSGGDSLYNTSVNNITLNTWTHICYTWDGTNMKLYINGINDSNFTYKNGNTHRTGNLLNIGGDIYNANTGGSKYFNGSISDVHIYATTLSEEDIKELYNTPTNIDNQGDIFSFEFDEDYSTERELNPVPISGFTVTNDGYKVSGHTWPSADYIPISPSGKTYYYDIEYSNVAGNHLYIGFERYDINKASGSNNECQYVVNTTSVANHVRVTGTINLSTANGNTAAFTKLRILNNWDNSSNVNYIGTIHYISLKEVTSIKESKIEKTGQMIGNTFIESKNASISKTGNIIGNQFIEK